MESKSLKTILEAEHGEEAKLYQFVMEMTLPQVKKAVLALCEKVMKQHQIQDPMILEAWEATQHAPVPTFLIEKFEEEAHQYDVINHAFQEQMELYPEKSKLYNEKSYFYFVRYMLLDALVSIMQDLEIRRIHQGLYDVMIISNKDENIYSELRRAKAEN